MRDLYATLGAAGYDTSRLPGALVRGKFYRLPAPGCGKADRSGWLKLLDDGLAVFGDWRSGQRQTWRTADNDSAAPRDPRADPARQAARDRQLAERRTVAANAAARAWSAGTPTSDHPYLTRKGITAAGLRVDGEGRLLVPVYNAATGALVSVQRIDRDGEKRFLYGSTTEAGHYVIPGAEPRVFCEGLATGATINAATGRAAVVCFNAGNLPLVARILAQRGDVVAADNDNAAKPSERFGKRLATYGAGHRAAMATGLPWYMPHRPGADWNDVGVDATAVAFAGKPTSAAPVLNA